MLIVRETEALLAARWRAGAFSGQWLRTATGEEIAVLFPGRPGGPAGPDFRDAVLLRRDGSRLHGDIELHLRARNWHAHGHDRDARYDGVVLHVVRQAEGARATPLASGRWVAVAELEPAPVSPVSSPTGPPGGIAPLWPCAQLGQRLAAPAVSPARQSDQRARGWHILPHMNTRSHGDLPHRARTGVVPPTATAGNTPRAEIHDPHATPAGERLQKVLAHAGVASRRHAEALMAEGRVTVNGAVARQPGIRVDPVRDEVRVDGQPIRAARPSTYIVLNKPAGPVTTASDPQGRPTVLDLLPADLRTRRVYPVGRLDRDTEGLLLLTDDGALALRLTHPRYALAKEYHALVAGRPTPATLEQLALGVMLPGETRPTAPARAWIVRPEGDATWIALELHEGRNRQVRRMLDVVGHPVRRLRRARVGPLTLGSLAVGSWRLLTQEEVTALQRAVSGADQAT